jgi:hypothetical protein
MNEPSDLYKKAVKTSLFKEGIIYVEKTKLNIHTARKRFLRGIVEDTDMQVSDNLAFSCRGTSCID